MDRPDKPQSVVTSNLNNRISFEVSPLEGVEWGGPRCLHGRFSDHRNSDSGLHQPQKPHHVFKVVLKVAQAMVASFQQLAC